VFFFNEVAVLEVSLPTEDLVGTAGFELFSTKVGAFFEPVIDE
jgi:hypothetical protein